MRFCTRMAQAMGRRVRRAGALVLAGVVAVGASGGILSQPASTDDLPDGLPEGWYARIRTGFGELVVRLLPDQAPQSVAHFVAFAEGRMTWTDPLTGQSRRDRYYDGLTIHKVAKLERFEAGDPTATGRGSPPIYVPPELNGPVNFTRPYLVGMTRSSLGRISGSLFFVTAASLSYLTHRHPCIGEVVLGRDVVDRIVAVRVDGNDKPVDPIALESVRIVKVGDPTPIPDPVPFKPKIPVFGPKEKP